MSLTPPDFKKAERERRAQLEKKSEAYDDYIKRVGRGGEKMKLDRVALTDIRESASMQIQLTEEPAWKEALAELARAADRLDAMMARCFAEEEVPAWLSELK